MSETSLVSGHSFLLCYNADPNNKNGLLNFNPFNIETIPDSVANINTISDKIESSFSSIPEPYEIIGPYAISAGELLRDGGFEERSGTGPLKMRLKGYNNE